MHGLGTFDQRVHRRGASAAGIRAGEEPVFAADGDAAQSSFGGVVVEGQAAIIEAPDERRPARPHIAEGGGELGFARQLAHGLVGPGGQRLGDRLRSLLSLSSSMIRRHASDRVLDPIELAYAVERLLGDR
jgi:hypothetical protein